VSGFVRNEKLREALSFHTLLVGGNPMTTSAIYALIHKLEKDGGVWFAKGGTNKLSPPWSPTSSGSAARCACRTRSPRSRCWATTSPASDGSGGRIAADAVASNGDIVHTYRDLLSQSHRGRQAAKSLEGKRFSPSLFVVHFGITGTWPASRTT
jgi:phytoene desaturase